MRRSRPRSIGLLGLVATVAAVAASCVGGDAEVREPVPTLFAEIPSTEAGGTTVAPSTVPTPTTPIAERLPEPSRTGSGAVRVDDGTARAITGTDGEVWFVLGACTDEAVAPAASATLIGPQHVVLDPGAGGTDRGGGGLVAAELNLDVAERTAALLRAEGVGVTLTRTADADLSSRARGALAPAVGALALVSIHHVAAAPGAVSGPEARPQVFHQAGEADSRRLAGLIHEELVDAWSAFDTQWTQLDEPGVRSLLNQRGDDYFVVLRESAGSAAARVEVAALGEIDAALLTSEVGRSAEARALADALVRFLVTEEQGTGFIEPTETVRTAPTSNTPGGCGG